MARIFLESRASGVSAFARHARTDFRVRSR